MNINKEILEILNQNVSTGLDKYHTRDDKWYMEIYRDDEEHTSIQVYATNLHTNKTYHGSMSFELDDEGYVTEYLPTQFREEA